MKNIIFGFLGFLILRRIVSPEKKTVLVTSVPEDDPRNPPLLMRNRGVGDGQNTVEPVFLYFRRR